MAKKCEFCSGKFAHADSLRRHQQKYHKELMEKDEDEEEEEEDSDSSEECYDDSVDNTVDNEIITDVLLKAMHVMGVSYTVSQIKDNYDDVLKAFKDQVFFASSYTSAQYDLNCIFLD